MSSTVYVNDDINYLKRLASGPFLGSLLFVNTEIHACVFDVRSNLD